MLRRCLFALLAVLFALQSTWVLASDCICSDEAVHAAAPAGVPGVEDIQGAPEIREEIELDAGNCTVQCNACHLGCAATPSTGLLLSTTAASLQPDYIGLGSGRGYVQGPERPNWRPFA
jgi:hypothetical protein